ncbi:hypothetical protein B0H12DRAFT_281727 [Mycena haematopus]|nr:hypothetical protein B0H12DRAFT_281727 [Mycena haematopus]
MAEGMISNPLPLTKHVLQSSQRLSAAEIATATEFISVGEHHISDVDAAIARTDHEVELDDLMQQRATIVEQVLQHKIAIRSIRRLPPEIPPWHLGHICQYWRDVALASPDFWSDIVIMKPNDYPVEKLQALLARASNSALKFRFWAPNVGRRNPRVKELLQTMVGYGDRWISASIAINPTDWDLLAPLQGRIPLLRHLRIDVSDFEGFYQNPAAATVSEELSDPFEVAPALRDVILEDMSGLPHSIILPFQQLTRLTVTDTQDAITALLPTAPNLEVASLNFVGDYSDSELYLVLPRLRRLYTSSQPFLNHLELPAVEEIYMVDTDPTPFLSLVKRCPTIRLTTLRLAWCTSRHISRILEACPTIQTLGLHLFSEANDVFSELTVRRTGADTYTGIGPNVHTISLGVDRTMLDYGLFVSMVESRWRVPADGSLCRLSSVEVLAVDNGRLPSASMERLDGMKAEGLRVSILLGSEAHLEMMNWRP